MTTFERKLLDKGYIKHTLDCKTMTYRVAKDHDISTMVNLDHRYFLSSKEGMKAGAFDSADEIIFGLNEVGKPSTLTYPRPSIIRKADIDGETRYTGNQYDDNMNRVLSSYSFDEVFEAMYDKEIVFILD